MHSIRFFVITLLVINLLLLGVEASKPRVRADLQTLESDSAPDSVPHLLTVAEIVDVPEGDTGLECYTVGPFENAQTSGAIAGLLGGHASLVSQRTTEAFVDRGYWVYLAPASTAFEGQAAVNMLFDAGIEDVRLIESGEFNNAVSLGYFIEQDNAIRRRDMAKALGFDVAMTIQRQDESRYWVDYRQQAGVEYGYRILVDVVPGDLHRQTVCPANVIIEPDLAP